MKRNIKDFSNAIAIINQLQPKNYEFRNDGIYSNMHLPKGNHYGLLAQDVEKVLPYLVKESSREFSNKENGKLNQAGRILTTQDLNKQQEAKERINIKAINYIELIPVMIKATQEQEVVLQKQQTQIDELNKRNEDLQAQINELKALMIQGGYTTQNTSLENGYLKQNAPNPARGNTLVRYYLPENADRAQIRITDEKELL